MLVHVVTSYLRGAFHHLPVSAFFIIRSKLNESLRNLRSKERQARIQVIDQHQSKDVADGNVPFLLDPYWTKANMSTAFRTDANCKEWVLPFEKEPILTAWYQKYADEAAEAAAEIARNEAARRAAKGRRRADAADEDMEGELEDIDVSD